MSKDLNQVNNEIDLIDLLRVLVVNKRIILITWLVIIVEQP